MDAQMAIADDTRKSKIALMLLASLHVLLYLPCLGSLEAEYDEGIYIQLARLIAEGQTPHQDFFYHQPSTYLYFLSFIARWAPDSVWLYRLPSLLATTLSGVLLYGIARRWMRPTHALFVPFLFYFAPLQDYGRLALPYGLMVCFTLAGLYAIFSWRCRKSALVAGLFMGLAVVIRALALPVCMLTSCALLLVSAQRARFIPYVAALTLTGLFGWAVLHLLSDGGFSELLTFELTRASGDKGFSYLLSMPGFMEGMESKGLQTGLERTLAMAADVAFTSPDAPRFLGGIFFPHVILLLLAILGCGVSYGSNRDEGQRVHPLMLAWFAGVLTAIFTLWALPWEDYFLEAMAPLAIYAGVGFGFFWGNEGRRLLYRVLIICFLSLYALTTVGTSYTNARGQQEAWDVVSSSAHKGPWLTFDPLMHLATGREVACGIVDPLVGHFLRHDIAELRRFSHQAYDNASLLACLRQSPDTPILIHLSSLNFIDSELAEMMACDLSNPLVFMGDVDRLRFSRRLGKIGKETVECLKTRELEIGR